MGFVFALAYFREWFDSTVRTAEEVYRSIPTALLGSVPHFRAPSPVELQSQQATGISPALWYYHRPGSAEAEAYRTVRTTLFASTKNSGDKVLHFSSPEPGDGKSTTISNLAIAIAQSGKKVLLIDADLRRPTIDTLFGMRPEVGLSEVLRRDIHWENAVQSSRIDGLSILTSGRAPANPAELLSLATLPQLLREVRTEYDYILIDSPPMLAVSDPCILAPHTDGLVLVVRLQKNKRASLDRTRALIDTHGVHLCGFIANDLSNESGDDPALNYGAYYQDSRTPADLPAMPAAAVAPSSESRTLSTSAARGYEALRDRYANVPRRK
ncbi:MAG: CpsD/CapB family tyrosine-protein kinase [Planctomycetaceae bacterium]